jgi:hypothetical protein
MLSLARILENCDSALKHVSDILFYIVIFTLFSVSLSATEPPEDAILLSEIQHLYLVSPFQYQIVDLQG